MSLFLGVSAINTGNNLLYLILAALLGVLAVSGFFGKRNLSDIDVRIRFPEEIYAGTPAPVIVLVRNVRRRTPSFLVRVAVGEVSLLFPYIRAGGEDQRMIELTFTDRGIQTIDTCRIASVYPFNFFIRRRTLPLTARFTVFPHPVSMSEDLRTDLHQKPRGDHSRERPGYDGDILAIRDYMIGDPVRYINWKASARTGAMKTNELTAAYGTSSIIEFEKIAITDLEIKLSYLTFLVLTLFRKNRPVGLKMGGKYFPPAATKEQKLRLLRELAVYGKGMDRDGL